MAGPRTFAMMILESALAPRLQRQAAAADCRRSYTELSVITPTEAGGGGRLLTELHGVISDNSDGGRQRRPTADGEITEKLGAAVTD